LTLPGLNLGKHNQIKFETIDLEVLESIKAEFYNELQKKGLYLNIKIPGALHKIKADKDVLTQIFTNLISPCLQNRFIIIVLKEEECFIF